MLNYSGWWQLNHRSDFVWSEATGNWHWLNVAAGMQWNACEDINLLFKGCFCSIPSNGICGSLPELDLQLQEAFPDCLTLNWLLKLDVASELKTSKKAGILSLFAGFLLFCFLCFFFCGYLSFPYSISHAWDSLFPLLFLTLLLSGLLVFIFFQKKGEKETSIDLQAGLSTFMTHADMVLESFLICFQA